MCWVGCVIRWWHTENIVVGWVDAGTVGRVRYVGKWGRRSEVGSKVGRWGSKVGTLRSNGVGGERWDEPGVRGVDVKKEGWWWIITVELLNYHNHKTNPLSLPIPYAVFSIPLYGRIFAPEIKEALSPWIWRRVLVISNGNVTAIKNQNTTN